LGGQKLIEQGKYAEAIEKLETATSILTTNAQAWNYLGLALHYGGRPAEAEKAYQRALVLDHDLSEAHYNLGCLWLEQNRPDHAKTELTAFTLRRGNSLDALLRLGSAQLRSSDLAGAEKSFDDALRLLPENPDALNGLGLSRISRHRAPEAAQFFTRALKQRPGYAPALLNLAIVHQQYLKDPQTALQRYREYLALEPPPSNSDAVAAACRQLEQELTPPRPAATSVVVSPVVPPAPAPKAPATNLNRAPAVPKTASVANTSRQTSVPPDTGKVELVKVASEPVFKPARDVAPATAPSVPASSEAGAQATVPAERSNAASAEKPGFLERINPANLFRGEPKTPTPVTPLPSHGTPSPEPTPAATDFTDAALAVTDAASSRYLYKSPPAPTPGDRPSAERSFAQGVEAQEAKKPADAEQAYRSAVQFDPSYFEAQFNLALAATEAGHIPVALSAYEYALAIRQDSADARYNFAIVLKQSNHLTDAANELQKLVARHPNETRAHLALGNLYARQLNQPAKARVHYQKVLDADPRHPQAAAIRYWLSGNPP
jgi:tetratricopeptide (TPR) repeat protein